MRIYEAYGCQWRRLTSDSCLRWEVQVVHKRLGCNYFHGILYSSQNGSLFSMGKSKQDRENSYRSQYLRAHRCDCAAMYILVTATCAWSSEVTQPGIVTQPVMQRLEKSWAQAKPNDRENRPFPTRTQAMAPGMAQASLCHGDIVNSLQSIWVCILMASGALRAP